MPSFSWWGCRNWGRARATSRKNLMHVGICVLLLPYGYYKELGRDPDGWPHFERDKELPPLSDKEQERLMKEAVLLYFDER
jgi:hypothetical protein